MLLGWVRAQLQERRKVKNESAKQARFKHHLGRISMFKFSENRPCWPSSLSHRSNSSRVAAEDPLLNPAWGMYVKLPPGP